MEAFLSPQIVITFILKSWESTYRGRVEVKLSRVESFCPILKAQIITGNCGWGVPPNSTHTSPPTFHGP